MMNDHPFRMDPNRLVASIKTHFRLFSEPEDALGTGYRVNRVVQGLETPYVPRHRVYSQDDTETWPLLVEPKPVIQGLTVGIEFDFLDCSSTDEIVVAEIQAEDPHNPVAFQPGMDGCTCLSGNRVRLLDAQVAGDE